MLHADVPVAQVSLAAPDDLQRGGGRGTAGPPLHVVPEAALPLDGRAVNQPEGGEALLAQAAGPGLTGPALADARLLPEDGSAGARFAVWSGGNPETGWIHYTHIVMGAFNEMAFSQPGEHHRRREREGEIKRER